ncbi:MAG: hypothetical protein PHW10_05050 [Candidatus Peribacteraceae bacterium]|nr:hypothetical protein [Candidatus Peribacteraceae bacterium]
MFAYKHLKRLLLILTLLLGIVAVWKEGWTFLPAAHAQVFNAALNSATLDISTGLTMVLTSVNVIMWFLFQILELIMDPAFIFGEGYSVMDVMQQVWMVSRDLVNLIFAFVLIGGAAMTVLRANTDLLKSTAPRFVIALIAVNLTWFATQVLFDVSQVLTAAIYYLPQSLNEGKCEIFIQNKEVKECQVVERVAYSSQISEEGLTHGTDGWQCLADVVCVKFVKYSDSEKSTPMKVLNGLVVNHGHLATLAFPFSSTSRDEGFMTLIVRMAVVLFIHLMLFFPMVALVFAFIVRIPILWVTMAFMPFVALGYVLPPSLTSGADPKKIMATFLTSVFLPAMVAVPFALGFIMVNAGLQSSAPAAGGALDELTLFAGLNDIWELVWLAVSIGIIWTGVFMVLKKQEIGQSFVSGVQNFGGTLGKAVAQTPLLLPLPMAKGSDGKSATPMQILKSIQYGPKNVLAEGTWGAFFKGKQGEQNRIKDAADANHTNTKITQNIRIIIDDMAKPEARATALQELRTGLNAGNASAQSLAGGVANSKLKDSIPGLPDPKKLQSIIEKIEKNLSK